MKDHDGNSLPNPGSPEAYEQGCNCSRLDNNDGQAAPFISGLIEGWWISETCPLHAMLGDDDEASAEALARMEVETLHQARRTDG